VWSDIIPYPPALPASLNAVLLLAGTEITTNHSEQSPRRGRRADRATVDPRKELCGEE
jgi:hypothetical protein